MIVLATTHDALSVTLHRGFASVVLIYAAFMALWGFFLYLRGSNPSGSYIGALILAEAVAILQGIFGLVLIAQGHRPADALHWLYGGVIILTLPTAYLLSSNGTTRRDSLIFGLAGALLVGLAIRAFATGSA